MAKALHETIKLINQLKRKGYDVGRIDEKLREVGIRSKNYIVAGFSAYGKTEEIVFFINTGKMWSTSKMDILMDIAKKYGLKIRKPYPIGRELVQNGISVATVYERFIAINPNYKMASQLLEELGDKLFDAKCD
jgi:hypothetical protein